MSDHPLKHAIPNFFGLTTILTVMVAALVFPIPTSPSLSAAENAEEKKAEKPLPPSLLRESGLVPKPDFMVRTKILGDIDRAKEAWVTNYEKLKTADEIAAYQKTRKDFFWKQLGKLWEKTPLHPKVTASFAKENYRVEKIVLETLPGFYATGTVFLPLEGKFAPPYPALLIVCGHSSNGKAEELYQGLGILAAMNGLAAYVQDPIDQGERIQYAKDGKPILIGTGAHNVVGSGSILLGRNAATFEIWDMVRAVDYLQSRPDVIPEKIGVAGNSGGGTQSSYLMALDERIAVAAPSCYLCSLFGNLTHQLGPQDAEQCLAGQIAFGLDHADYPLMRAPKPTLLCAKTKDFFNINDTWVSYRYNKRIFTRLRAGEKLAIVEMDGEHGYCPELLESTVRWMLRWLAGRDEMIVCPEKLPTLTADEIRSTEKGILGLDGARTTYDLNRDLNAELTAARKEKLSNVSAEEFAGIVRQAAVIRPESEIPAAEVKFTDEKTGDVVFETEPGIFLALRRENRDSTGGTIRLVVTEKGRRAPEADAVLAARPADAGPSFVVELRGWGESQNVSNQYYRHEWFGDDSLDAVYAYLIGKSYISMRAEDLIATAKRLKDQSGKNIELAADGPSAGLVVLHAAASQPGFFAGISVPENIPTWASLVEMSPTPIRLTDTIHGVLNSYDVDDLIRFVK